jgi:hypothetical protein
MFFIHFVASCLHSLFSLRFFPLVSLIDWSVFRHMTPRMSIVKCQVLSHYPPPPPPVDLQSGVPRELVHRVLKLGFGAVARVELLSLRPLQCILKD